MTEIIEKKDRPLFLFRIVIPAYPEVNIFTRQAQRTTALGPIMVATIASELPGWRVEVIDENNCNGPRDSQGLIDHSVLQKENRATAVGFYCGVSCTMQRVRDSAEFYRQNGVPIIAGGCHAYYCPEETLRHNIDIVVSGDGEPVIQQILNFFEKGGSLKNIPGISFMENGQMVSNPPEMLEVSDLNDLPHPNFGLLEYAKMKLFPISRIRGCNMNCEFCSVCGAPRWASAQHLFDTVKQLVKEKKARHFFVVDDNSWQDIEGTKEFFKMVAEEYGSRFHFTVQVRLETAQNIELLEIMKKAGVRVVCVGCESPRDEDLQVMRKGYSSLHMLEWVKVLRRYFWVHGMFMVGYPAKEEKSPADAKKIFECFREFIRKASLDSIQILFPVPIPGSKLRERLKKEGRILSAPWKKYDGSCVCFQPDNMKAEELQEIGLELMSGFYNSWSFVGIIARTISFPRDYFIKKKKHYWHREAIKCGGYLLLRQWRKNQKY